MNYFMKIEESVEAKMRAKMRSMVDSVSIRSLVFEFSSSPKWPSTLEVA